MYEEMTKALRELEEDVAGRRKKLRRPTSWLDAKKFIKALDDLEEYRRANEYAIFDDYCQPAWPNPKNEPPSEREARNIQAVINAHNDDLESLIALLEAGEAGREAQSLAAELIKTKTRKKGGQEKTAKQHRDDTWLPDMAVQFYRFKALILQHWPKQDRRHVNDLAVELTVEKFKEWDIETGVENADALLNFIDHHQRRYRDEDAS